MAERNIANSRVTELEECIAALEKEAASAQQETTTAIQRAEKAEEKEQAAAKQEEDLFPRVEAVINCLMGNFSYLLLAILFHCPHFVTKSLLFRNFCRDSGHSS